MTKDGANQKGAGELPFTPWGENNFKTRLDTLGHPHSDQMHLIERFQLTDAEHIAYEVTVDDPKTYTKPWKNARTLWRMKPGQELIEYSCEENNRDFTEGHIK
jgi:hypothetical protein